LAQRQSAPQRHVVPQAQPARWLLVWQPQVQPLPMQLVQVQRAVFWVAVLFMVTLLG
jgi:hypothetical protein